MQQCIKTVCISMLWLKFTVNVIAHFFVPSQSFFFEFLRVLRKRRNLHFSMARVFTEE